MSDTAPMIPVMSGDRCIGFVIARGLAGFEVFDADEKSLGIFPTLREGVASLMAGGTS